MRNSRSDAADRFRVVFVQVLLPSKGSPSLRSIYMKGMQASLLDFCSLADRSTTSSEVSPFSISASSQLPVSVTRTKYRVEAPLETPYRLQLASTCEMPQQTDSERMEVEDVVSLDPTTEDQAYMEDDEDVYHDEDEAREDDEPSAWAIKEELRRLLLTKNPSPASDLVCQTRGHGGKLYYSQSLRSLSISQSRPHSQSIWRGRSALLPSHLAGSQSSSQTKSIGRTPVKVPTNKLNKES